MPLTSSFRSAYDCLPRQLALSLGQSFCAVPVLHDGHPAVWNPSYDPIEDAVRAQTERTGESGNSTLVSNCMFKNVHTHDLNTTVRIADTHLQRQNEGMNKISERLKAARTRRGWNQAQLAVSAGVSPGTIGNIESGARQAKGSLPQIAKALGISHDWLANGEGEMLDNPARVISEESSGPSSQAALLALLFDKLANDLVLRAQVFNKASQIIIDTIQDADAQQTQSPELQSPVKKQSA